MQCRTQVRQQLVFGTVVKFPTLFRGVGPARGTVPDSDLPPPPLTIQIRLVDPAGRVVQNLWSSNRLTVEVLLDGPGSTAEATAPPKFVPVYHHVHVLPTTRAFPTGMDAVPVWIEVQLSSAPLEAALDVYSVCLECRETGLAVANVAGQTDCRYYCERQTILPSLHFKMWCLTFPRLLFAVPQFTARTASWPLLPWLGPRHTILVLRIATATSHQDCLVASAATATWTVSKRCLLIECEMPSSQLLVGPLGSNHRSPGYPPPWAPHPGTL
jgi:hypothetical protein